MVEQCVDINYLDLEENVNTFCRNEHMNYVSPYELIFSNIKYQDELRKYKIWKELQKKLQEKAIQQYYDNICYYNPNNISEISNISTNKIKELLNGTSFNTDDIANTIKYGETLEHPINAIFLISMLRWESGHGWSELARTHNNISSVKSRSGGWRVYDSYNECVLETIGLVSNQYLDPNGNYYNGKSIWSINEKYCETNEWADNINKIASELIN